jgi:acetylornithine/succinyldiaminopimelate/putrescine aminotransferase
LEALLSKDGSVSAVFLKLAKGEAGDIIPDDGYLKKVYDLTKKYDC